MAKWSLKNRDSDNQPPAMPPAAENYYRAEKRDRMIGVWLLGIATLVVTAILAFLLFLGGRWVYRQFTDNNGSQDTSQTETTNAPAQSEAGQGGGTAETDNQNDSEDSQEEGQTGGASDETDANEEGVVSDVAVNTDLPNTGPADTLALFVGVTIVATLVHRTILAKQTR